MTTRTRSRFDLHEAVTNQIVAAVEEGTGPFQMPWCKSGAAITRPKNISTGNAYRGVNTIALWAAAAHRGYTEGLWGTYRQWQKRGAQVRKGQKSSLIVFYKTFARDDAAQDDDPDPSDRRPIFYAKPSPVFNVAQVDGHERAESTADGGAIDAIAAADAFVQATGAVIREDGTRAFYRPAEDMIAMPDRGRFRGTDTSTATEGWYGVLLHELTHWIGAETRLDRTFGERFGDDAYAMEELVAELGAAFLCADLAITPEPRADHAAHIDHWLRVMKGDKKAVFTAASAAAKASDYLAGLQSAETGSHAVAAE